MAFVSNVKQELQRVNQVTTHAQSVQLVQMLTELNVMVRRTSIFASRDTCKLMLSSNSVKSCWGQFLYEKASESLYFFPITTESISKIDVLFQLRHVLLGTPRMVATVFSVNRELPRVSLGTTHAHYAQWGLLAMQGDSPNALAVQWTLLQMSLAR